MKGLRYLPIVGIIAVVIYLISTSFQEALTYYVTAVEFHAHTDQYSAKKIKVAGFVSEGSIQKDPTNPLRVHFLVREKDVRFPVVYEGLIPDTFKDGAEVVVTGKWNGTTFVATEVLAKCASKYSEKLSEDAK